MYIFCFNAGRTAVEEDDPCWGWTGCIKPIHQSTTRVSWFFHLVGKPFPRLSESPLKYVKKLWGKRITRIYNRKEFTIITSAQEVHQPASVCCLFVCQQQTGRLPPNVSEGRRQGVGETRQISEQNTWTWTQVCAFRLRLQFVFQQDHTETKRQVVMKPAESWSIVTHCWTCMITWGGAETEELQYLWK